MYHLLRGLRFWVSNRKRGVVKEGENGLRLKVKIKNHSLRKLLRGVIAGAVSRTVVAPLETIRTHLMVGSSGHSTIEVFDGWPGLFRGYFVNVIRVAQSKAIEIPVIYASGVTVMADLEKIKVAGVERVDVIVGSALDIFGGNLAYKDVVAWHSPQEVFAA